MNNRFLLGLSLGCSVFLISNANWAQTGKAWGCRPFLERIAEPEEATTIISGEKPYEILAHKAHKLTVIGRDSGHTYHPYWQFQMGNGRERPTHLRFFYHPSEVADGNAGPQLLLKPDALDADHHFLELQFPRGSTGEHQDIEILEGAFAHLNRVSVDGDSYSFHITDPKTVEDLNLVINYLTEELHAASVPLIKASPKAYTNPLQGEIEFDPNRDSYFSGLTLHQVRSLLKDLDQHMEVSKDLTRAFLKTRLGQTILASESTWLVRVDMIPEHLDAPRSVTEQASKEITTRIIYRVSLALR